MSFIIEIFEDALVFSDFHPPDLGKEKLESEKRK